MVMMLLYIFAVDTYLGEEWEGDLPWETLTDLLEQPSLGGRSVP